MEINDKQLQRMMEQLDLLTGRRGDSKRLTSAVRRGELTSLAQIGLLSEQVTAAPTMDQHNALQKDVANLFEALTRISNLLGNANLPTG